MKIQRILVTGDTLFLARHKLLFKSLSLHFKKLDVLTSSDLYEPKFFQKIMHLMYCVNHGVMPRNSEGFYKNPQAFIKRSKGTEKKIKQLEYTPDLVFHIFALCTPFWEKSSIPYAMYLDYTMALAHRNYQPWAPFSSNKDLMSWLECERKSFQEAKYLFTMSSLVKSSLVEDYGIQPEKITVVGSSGNCQEVEQQEKDFGSQTILFNGSDFKRKGGELVLATFEKIRSHLPEAKLVIIGNKSEIHGDGIKNLGVIASASAKLRDIFLESDLVIAPGVCDPFPTFLLEAMAFGVPCVVSANDGMPEIVEHGKTGLVISERNPDLFASEIIQLICDKSSLKIMSKNAKDKIKTKFNWSNIAKMITQVLVA